MKANSYIDPHKNFSTLCPDIQEIEANQFALELLMPENAVIYYAGKLDSVQELAEKFAVSEVAMTARLNQLGLLSDV